MRNWTQVASTVLIVLTLSGSVHAQNIVYADAHGTRILLSEKNLGQFAAPAAPGKTLMAGSLAWNITYQDVSSNNNIGFDDPVNGAARRATAEAVMQYIGEALNLGVSRSVDISFKVSQMDSGDELASAGTFWNTTPSRFDNGFAFQHITTGTDPAPLKEDIYCTVDFGYPWNEDHTQDPTPSEFDLFSVLLHEMTHGIGLLSLSDGLGRGIGPTGEVSTNPGVYTKWDQLMRYGANSVCWNASTTTLLVPTSAFISDNLFFSGANATAAYGSRPPIYAPSSYIEGSSLAHFKTGVVDSVMQHAIGIGVVQREYTAVDIAALKDIGYTNAIAPVTVSINTSSGGHYVEGQAITLTATASGATGYQWYHNNQAIPSANQSAYSISSATTGDSGTYYCEVTTTTHGVVTSPTVDVVVHAPADLPAGGFTALAILILTLTAAAATLAFRPPRASAG
ncbi:MAG: immunoglobulin domain-containing protein [FCB group bacterium]|jgi:hypothetical protein|nr:immunoglobulin domain-containing protein [FCB group bacterium]